MRNMKIALVSSLVLGALGCNDAAPSSTGSSLGANKQAIYKGTADSTSAVMAIAIDLGNGQGAACTGTVVAVKGNSGYMLTAAHCVTQEKSTTMLQPSQLAVLAGPDYSAPSAVYQVAEVKAHPSYNPQFVSYDFAMLRFTFSGQAPQTVPAMQASEDNLAVGGLLDVIGYGQTDTNPQNSVRNHATMKISGFDFNDTLVVLGQQDNSSITCSGDSGGPGMAGSGAAKRVATVTSFGFAANCTLDTAGVGRVSKVYASFIKPFLDGSAGTLSCDECTSASTQLGGSCYAQVDACQKTPDCQAFIDCANACGASDNACFQKCQTDHKTGVDVYSKIFDCTCDTGCATECAAEPQCQKSCGFSYAPDGFPNCNSCVQSKCCDVDQACFDDAACNACATGSTDPACETNEKLKAFSACINTTCGAECGAPQCGFSTSFDGFPECDACVQATCCDVNKACYDDPACSACATGSTDPACETNAKLKAFTDCIYGSTCGQKCGAAKCGFTSQDATCQTCFEGACCTEFSACQDDALCGQCMTGQKSGAECDGSQLFKDALGCLDSKCGAECNSGAGGASGAGGNGAGGVIGTAGSGTAGSGTAGSGTAGSGTAGSGTAGNGEAGSGEAGAAGEDGTGGTSAAGSNNAAGNATAGTAGSGAGGAAAGQGGTGNPSTTPASTTTSETTGSCSCQTPGNTTPASGAPALALAALMLLRSRRRKG